MELMICIAEDIAYSGFSLITTVHLYINSGKSGSLFFVFSGKLRDGFLSNFAILFSILLSGL